MTAYYNEFDHEIAEWLRELIYEGFLPYGEVDERSITEVTPNDLKGFAQCHFFAGIGGWPLALRYAGLPDSFPVWTGSCPCQAFSIAGKKHGFTDERHLWPVFFRLIEACKPSVVVGEQVEAAIRYGWLDLVEGDLRGAGYGFGAAVLPAAGIGAPHIRKRLYWGGVLADDNRLGLQAGLLWEKPRASGIGEGNLRHQDELADACCDGCRGGIPREAIESPQTFKSMVKNLYLCRRMFGNTVNGGEEPTGRYAWLNPGLSRWLMGFPPEWDVCAVMAMPSSRKSDKSSSKSS